VCAATIGGILEAGKLEGATAGGVPFKALEADIRAHKVRTPPAQPHRDHRGGLRPKRSASKAALLRACLRAQFATRLPPPFVTRRSLPLPWATRLRVQVVATGEDLYAINWKGNVPTLVVKDADGKTTLLLNEVRAARGMSVPSCDCH